MTIKSIRWLAIASVAATLGVQAQSTVNLTGVVQIRTSDLHGCAVTTAGQVKCWGSNQRGELGDGSVNSRSVAADVVGLADATSVSAGGVVTPLTNASFTRFGHTCAVATIGEVKCWGGNESGQLGDGTATDRLTPVGVILGTTATAVAAGGKHTCALTSASGVKCWGANDMGQLGNGTTAASALPVDVSGLQSGVSQIVAAYRHTCALMTTGAVKCWGANESGQVGDGTTIARSTPTDVAGLQSGVAHISAGGGEHWGFASESAGSESCAVTSGGAFCWGHVFPHGSLTPRERVASGSGVLQVAPYTGSQYGISSPGSGNVFHYRSCVVLSGGGVRCQDANAGNEFFAPSIQVTGLAGPAAQVATLQGFSSCALLQAGTVQCWGTPTAGTSAMYLQTTASGLNPQSILFTAPNGNVRINVGATYTLAVNGGGSGNPVVFTSATPSICSISGSVVTGVAQGKCIINANQAGNSEYEAAPQAPAFLSIGPPAPQTIAFGTAPMVAVGGAGTVSATASSGLTPVIFASNTPSTCSVSGNVVTGVAAGTCLVAASQAGDYYYAAVQAIQSISIVNGNLSVTLAGGGFGTVTSAPAGINCPPNCAGAFAPGSVVTLTAVPAANNTFGGWSGGGCSGTGTCEVTISGTVGVTATFLFYTGELKTRYRLYSPTTKEHLYTTDFNEYSVLPSCCGWVPEGAIHKVLAGPGTYAGTSAVPYYRLYNPASYQHHWTTDLNEYNFLPSVGWIQEGIDGYILPTQAGVAVPLYRLYLNQAGGLHLWTTEASERNYLTSYAGWVYEGIAGYVFPLN